MNTYRLIGLFIESPDTFLQALGEETGRSFLNPEDVAPYIPFTKKEVMEYIHRNRLQSKLMGGSGEGESAPYEQPSAHDGTYLVEEGGSFVLYSQERGVRSEVKTFTSKSDALASVKNEQDTDAIERYVDTLFQIYTPREE